METFQPFFIFLHKWQKSFSLSEFQFFSPFLPAPIIFYTYKC